MFLCLLNSVLFQSCMKFHTTRACNAITIKRSYLDHFRLFSIIHNKLNSPVFIVDMIPEAWSVDHRQLHSHSFLLDI